MRIHPILSVQEFLLETQKQRERSNLAELLLSFFMPITDSQKRKEKSSKQEPTLCRFYFLSNVQLLVCLPTETQVRHAIPSAFPANQNRLFYAIFNQPQRKIPSKILLPNVTLCTPKITNIRTFVFSPFPSLPELIKRV